MNKLYVKVFVAKSGKKAFALCLNRIYLTFDRNVIIEALDVRPSELEKLDVGDYPIK